MPKPASSKPVLNTEPDDLDVDEEEVEEEEEGEAEEAEEEEEEEDDASEEEAEDEEEDAPVPPKKTAKRGPKKKGTASKKSSGTEYGVVLVNGVPAKVEVVAVRGEIAKVRKPKTDDAPIKISVALVRVFDEDAFNKMLARAEKISALKDANIATHQKMAVVSGKKTTARKPRKGNPLEGLL